jgi:cell division protein FtsL
LSGTSLSDVEMTLLTGQLINLHRTIQSIQQMENQIHNQLKSIAGNEKYIAYLIIDLQAFFLKIFLLFVGMDLASLQQKFIETELKATTETVVEELQRKTSEEFSSPLESPKDQSAPLADSADGVTKRYSVKFKTRGWLIRY